MQVILGDQSGNGLLFDATGIDSKQRVDRAIADQAGNQRDEAHPSPSGLWSNKDKGYKAGAQNDPQTAIKPSFVAKCHGESPSWRICDVVITTHMISHHAVFYSDLVTD